MDLQNKAALQGVLDKLNEYAEPLWGKMTPQHVIEHLTASLHLVNGKKDVKQFTTPEEAQAVKNRLIGSEEPFARGIKSPMLGDEPPAYLHPSLGSAKEELVNEINEFNAKLQKDPEAHMLHPRLGTLNMKEWNKLFSKHFDHHFNQFGLLNEPAA